MDRECRKSIQDNDAMWLNNLHRVTQERDESQKAFQTNDCELKAARSACQRAEQETMTIHKEKTDLESKIKKYEQAKEESSRVSLEVSNLKEQLRQKDDVLRTKDCELSRLAEMHNRLQIQNTTLEETVNQFRLRVSQKEFLIVSLRKELEAQLTETSRQNMLRESEVQNFQELEEIRREVVELQTGKEVNEQEMQRMRKVIQELHERDAEHSAAQSDLERRCAQANATLTEYEAVYKHPNFQNDLNLEGYKKEIREKYQTLAQGMEEKYQKHRPEFQKIWELERKEQLNKQIREENNSARGAEESEQGLVLESFLTSKELSKNMLLQSHISTSKKKVNYEGNSIESAHSELSHNQESFTQGGINAAKAMQDEDGGFDRLESINASDVGVGEQLELNEVSILDQPRYNDSSASDLTDMSSSLLEMFNPKQVSTVAATKVAPEWCTLNKTFHPSNECRPAPRPFEQLGEYTQFRNPSKLQANIGSRMGASSSLSQGLGTQERTAATKPPLFNDKIPRRSIELSSSDGAIKSLSASRKAHRSYPAKTFLPNISGELNTPRVMGSDSVQERRSYRGRVKQSACTKKRKELAHTIPSLISSQPRLHLSHTPTSSGSTHQE